MTRIVKIGEKGLSLIKATESFKSKPYVDPATKGKPYTIGYGSTYYEDGTRVTMQDLPISESRASILLDLLLDHYEKSVDSLTVDTINQNQFDALCSFAYNCGVANLKSSTLLKKVNANPNDISIAKEFAKWNRANGKVMNGLITRRKKESDLYFTK